MDLLKCKACATLLHPTLTIMLQIYRERPHQHLHGQNEELSEYTFGAVEHFYPKLQQLDCVHCLYSREEKKDVSQQEGQEGPRFKE